MLIENTFSLKGHQQGSFMRVLVSRERGGQSSYQSQVQLFSHRRSTQIAETIFSSLYSPAKLGIRHNHFTLETLV